MTSPVASFWVMVRRHVLLTVSWDPPVVLPRFQPLDVLSIERAPTCLEPWCSRASCPVLLLRGTDITTSKAAITTPTTDIVKVAMCFSFFNHWCEFDTALAPERDGKKKWQSVPKRERRMSIDTWVPLHPECPPAQVYLSPPSPRMSTISNWSRRDTSILPTLSPLPSFPTYSAAVRRADRSTESCSSQTLASPYRGS